MYGLPYQLKDILMSRDKGGGIVLAEMLITASRDSEAFAAASELCRDVTTATEVSGIMLVR